jgi:cysteine desulfurase
MTANNEIGTLQDIDAIGQIACENGIVFHSDCVQALLTQPIDVSDIRRLNMASFSSHKIHGLKGTGCLYIGDGIKLAPLAYGGLQERGISPGTENVLGAVAFGQGVDTLKSVRKDLNTSLSVLKSKLISESVKTIPSIKINGHPTLSVPSIANISFPGCDSEALQLLLDCKHIFVSGGAACSTEQHRPSRILRAIGCTDNEVNSAIRFSFGRFNTLDEIEYVVPILAGCVERLRAINSV